MSQRTEVRVYKRNDTQYQPLSKPIGMRRAILSAYLINQARKQR